MEDYRTWANRNLMTILRANDYLPIELDMEGSLSFDILAKGSEETVILKSVYNVDTLKIDMASELYRLSTSMDLVPIIIGYRSGSGELEDNVMYFRHKIPIMTIETFREYVKGNRPTMYSGPGGYYVNIDGKKMQELRAKKGCSIGYVSGKIGISRRSISLYETGNSTTLDVFNKLRALLGEDISRSIDLRETLRETKLDNASEESDNEFIKGIRQVMGGFGMITEFFRKLPFDALSEEQSDLVYIMGISEKNKFETKKIAYIRNICNILEKEPVLISTTDTSREIIGGCSVITFKELLELGSLENFQKRIEKIKESIQ